MLAPTVTRRLIEQFARQERTDRFDASALRDLTPREVEVLRLIAGGRSNGEIAADLVVAAQTVKTHVGNILRTLQLRDRAQAIVTAYETGLVVPGR